MLSILQICPIWDENRLFPHLPKFECNLSVLSYWMKMECLSPNLPYTVKILKIGTP